MLDEFSFIEFLRKKGEVNRILKRGIGEDCAVLDFGSDYYILITQDMLIEGVHFKKSTPLGEVLLKAFNVSLSDIASCAGKPVLFFLSIGLPPAYLKELKNSFGYLFRYLKKYNVKLAGGDTNKSPVLCLDSVLLGLVKRRELVTRKGAKTGDYIFVTGKLGKARFRKNHIYFSPPLRESWILSRFYRIHSMVDISDGLSQDLYRILRENGVGALIFEKNIPLYPQASLKDALFYGEDFELLFTLSSQESQKLMKSTFYKKSDISFIGRIIPQKRLIIEDREGKRQIIKPKGYLHF